MKRPSRRRILLFLLAAVLLTVVLGVWITYQFPSLAAGRKSSVEVLEDLFKAPVVVTEENAQQALKDVSKDAAVVFIRACDLPADVEARLLAALRAPRLDSVTVPFIFHLYEMYGAPSKADPDELADLIYDAPPPSTADASGDRVSAKPKGDQSDAAQPGGADLGDIVRYSPQALRHASHALRLYDALFLRVKPGAENAPTPWRYDEAAYADVKAIVREMADEFLPPPDDSAQQPRRERNEYAKAFEEILRDDARFTDFVEFFTDFVRDLADGWVRAFVMRHERAKERSAWVEKCVAQKRYYEIADYAAQQLRRKLVVHVAVDGLQGKLLEGLAQLSSGDRDSAGARYVAELVRQHQTPEMDPSSYEPGQRSKLPPLGRDVVELATLAPSRPDYLENFKKYFYATDAQAVVVNVATVDTPTISVRNLPIIYSGHRVAGPFGTGIPNFSYLDRDTGRGWYFWGSDVLHFARIFGNREDEIPGSRKRPATAGARTPFERLWRYNTVSAMASIDTGALERISAEVGLAVGELKRDYIEQVLLLRMRRRAEMEQELNERRQWLADHRDVNHTFLAELVFSPITLKTFRDHARFIAEHEDEGLPDYLLWYNPWPDHFAHGKGPYSDEIIGYRGEYDRLDFFLGKLLSVYESVPTIDGAATYADRTLWSVVSDHGLVYTPRLVSTDALLFDAMRRDGIEVKYHKLTHDEGGLPAIHGRRHVQATRPFDAIVGSTAGGSYIIDLFDPQGLQGDEAAWRRHPDYHALRKHRLLSGQEVDWIELLKRHLHDTMDLALVRENGPAAGERWPDGVEAVVRVVTPARGEARIWRLRRSGADGQPRTMYRYEILGEHDPLDLVGSVREYLIPPDGPAADEIRQSLKRAIASTEGCSDTVWRELTSYTLRPDCVYQYSHLYDTDRAGTINVFPAAQVGMNSAVPGRHAGEMFPEKNGTQLYRGAGLQRGRMQTARNGSVPVTLYHWLVGDQVFRGPEAGFDVPPVQQFGYESLLDQPALAPLHAK